MPELSDFLGTVMGEIVKARLLADIQSREIAEAYAQDPVMRVMSVPRFKLPEIEIRLPVAIRSPEAEASPYPTDVPGTLPIDNQAVFSVTYKFTKELLQKEGISTDRKFYNAFNKSAYPLIRKMEDRIATDPSSCEEAIAEFARAIAKSSRKIISEFHPDLSGNFFVQQTEGIRSELSKLLKSSKSSAATGLEVIVEAAQLQAFPLESLIQLKLKVAEEDMLWTFGERENEDGGVETYRQLIPD